MANELQLHNATNESVTVSSALAKAYTDIVNSQKKGESSLKVIAKSLYNIRENKLYTELGYKDVYAYAKAIHGIARGSVSDSINTYKFSHDENGKELESYKDFTFTQLNYMRKLEEDKRKTIDVNTSTRELSEMVSEIKSKRKHKRKEKVFTLYFDGNGNYEETENKRTYEFRNIKELLEIIKDDEAANMILTED